MTFLDRNIIFCDIDGVFNSERTILVSEERGFFHFDPVAVKLVSLLCDNTDSKLVISSTWRLNYKEYALTHLLEVAGFQKKHFYYDAFYTPRNHSCVTRGEDVQGWIDINGVPKKYICIDDRADFFDYQNLVQTDPKLGFSADNYWDAMEKLGAVQTRKLVAF